MSADSSTRTIKYYTHARKFPQLLGKMPDGTKIPGGPYTIHQLLAGVGVLIVGAQTMGAWGSFGRIGNVLVLIGAVYLTIVTVGRMSTNGRNPLLIAAGLFRVIMAPRTGRFQGRPIRLRRPRRVAVRANLYRGPIPETEPAKDLLTVAEEPAVPTSAEALRAVRVRQARSVALLPTAAPDRPQAPIPLTGLQALLARTAATDETEEVR